MIEGFKSAMRSIWSNKVRSLLTVLGIVIGVTAVTTLVSLGQGLRNEVTNLVQGLGSNIVFVVGGNLDTENPQAFSNPSNFISGDVLKVRDAETASEIDGVESVSPMSLVSASIKYEGELVLPMTFGTNSDFINSFEIVKVKEGRFFEDNEKNVAVIDGVVKEALVGDGDIVGEMVIVDKIEFEIVGVIGIETAESIFGSEFSNMLLVPFDAATELNSGKEEIFRMIIDVADDYDVNEVRDNIYNGILENHEGEEDFSVLTQDDMLALLDSLLGLVTTMVTAIAAISLVVGGIGIMNIMLVTVTERTKEIGLRKAVGATKTSIALQFLIEAIVITSIGGALALGISFIFGFVVAAQTDITPDITLDLILIALGVSTTIGIVFGLWPALRAAKKDPIEALHYE